MPESMSDPKNTALVAAGVSRYRSDMNAIARDQLLAQLNWRYATKQYDAARKIDPADWAALEESLVLSPSSLGLQPWRFIVVDDPATRAALLPASYGQAQVVEASHLVVFATKTHVGEAEVDALVQRTARVRGVTSESLAGLRSMGINSVVHGMDESARLAWAKNQTYIALGNFLTSAALLGIDATPMEGFDRAQYDSILDLREKGLTASVIAAVGYRAAGDKYATALKVRFPRGEAVLHV